jgi:hypothetical protein
MIEGTVLFPTGSLPFGIVSLNVLLALSRDIKYGLTRKKFDR